MLIPAALLLLAAVFAAVHHAEIVALRVGEPFGSIVLAVAVTVIEVALIVSMMLAAKDGGGALARDTVFAAVMLVLNGVVGLCLVLGGARHGEQSFQEHGAAAALSVLGTLAAITMILPNYTKRRSGPVLFARAIGVRRHRVAAAVRRVSVRADDPPPGLFHRRGRRSRAASRPVAVAPRRSVSSC